jgi:15-hydroxyprostaglandin dehydrogenase (NAD)
LTTLIRAFDQLLASDQSGQVLEASGEQLHLRPQQEYPDEISKWVWDDAPAFWKSALTKLAKGE